MAVTLREVRLGFHHEGRAVTRRPRPQRLAGLGNAALCAEGRAVAMGVGNCTMHEVGGDARGLSGLGDLVFVVT